MTPDWQSGRHSLASLHINSTLPHPAQPFFINFIAIYYHASRAIPFGTMVAVTCICIFVILPLTLVGTVLGRNLAGNPDYPCRYKKPLTSKLSIHCIILLMIMSLPNCIKLSCSHFFPTQEQIANYINSIVLTICWLIKHSFEDSLLFISHYLYLG